MDQIIKEITSKCGSLPSIVFCDSGSSELLKWHGGLDVSPNVLVLSLSMLDQQNDQVAIDSWMKRAKPIRGIFIVNTPIRDIIVVIKRQCIVFNFGECIILTSSTTESTIRPNEVAELEEPYAFAKRLLRPTKSSILYFPLHTLSIQGKSTKNDVELFILSSPAIRDLVPLTLASLDNDNAPSIHDIEPADIPFNAKVQVSLCFSLIFFCFKYQYHLTMSIFYHISYQINSYDVLLMNWLVHSYMISELTLKHIYSHWVKHLHLLVTAYNQSSPLLLSNAKKLMISLEIA